MTQTLNSEAILKQLEWRYATKKFDSSKKIPAEILKTLKRVVALAPSSFGLQPFQILMIENPEIRKKLQAASWGQSQIVDASHLAVFTSQSSVSASDVDAYIERIIKTRGVTADSLKAYQSQIKGFAVDGASKINIQVWTQRQSYLAIGFLLQTAALLEIDACPMEGIDPVQYDGILGLKNFSTVAVVALGYRSAEDGYSHAKKVRKPEQELFKTI